MADKEQIREFLRRVATELNYRTQLENDPLSTLTAAGFTVTGRDLPSGGIKLPSNEEILANLDALTEGIESVHWPTLGG